MSIRDDLAYRWLKLKVKLSLNFGRDRHGSLMLLSWRAVQLSGSLRDRQIQRTSVQQKYKAHDSYAVGSWLILRSESED